MYQARFRWYCVDFYVGPSSNANFDVWVLFAKKVVVTTLQGSNLALQDKIMNIHLKIEL